MTNSPSRKTNWTSQDRARHKAVREEFQSKRPSLAELLAGGEYLGPLPLGAYLEMREALAGLKQTREAAGLSLADVSQRSGIDPATLSRLENGHQPNPTLETLNRYAAALGKQMVWVLRDLPTAST